MGLRSVCPARLWVTHPRVVAVALLALSLLGLMLAVHWTLDDRFGGGKQLRGKLTVRNDHSSYSVHKRPPYFCISR